MSKKVDFDDFTGNYNELLRESTQFFSSSEEYFAKYKIGLVRGQINKPVKRILEYGCGIGRNIRYLQEAFPGSEIVGTDISEASLSIAASENPGVLFEKECADTDVGVFDLIFVAGVFHHIPPSDRVAASKLLEKRLTNDGVLYVFEHNPYNPVTRKIVNNCPYDADAVLLKPSELLGLFERAEMVASGQGYCLFIPPKFSWLAPLEKYLEWLPLGGQYWVKATRKSI
ncbi:class I SAM-dependent methyltransferase [Pseudomonas izuensis]|uniref:class I SAM-dependent methyltransferase n=1 Tax=Pseudomonas izuensis TaxID=2684212 RepID=UPI0013597942|nr:class I SAM-dependent methyltransferase [Pseudomonas izuensis]